MPDWHRPKALAERWDVSVDTILNLLHEKKLLGKKIGGQWRVPEWSAAEYEAINYPKKSHRGRHKVEQLTGAAEEAMALYADK